MHFYYLDEAGCTGRNLLDENQPIFVLGGISVRDKGWNETQKSLSSVVEEYFDGGVPEDFELHAEELLSPEGDGPFSGHDRNRRNAFAESILRILAERRHDVHLFAIDKSKLSQARCDTNLPYDGRIPYHLAYDYLITYINWCVKEKLGVSARGMLIIDEKEQFHEDIERITHNRRFEGALAHRVKWIVEFSYPVDSQKNPMIQISDLVSFCSKKFFEVDAGYREEYPVEAKRFFAKCYDLIHARIVKKALVDRRGRGMERLNNFLVSIQAKPRGQWRRRYQL